MAGVGRGKGRRVRDDFSSAVKLTLAKRVNYCCSICDSQTTGPKTGSDDSFSIGKAAHIKAAAPGGPRYDATQTPEERGSIQNALWACATCADEIDRDEGAYPVDKLYQLKRAAEQRARARVGNPPQPASPVPKTHADVKRAVDLFCLTEAARCAQLDPRFNVSVGWANNRTVYEFHAKETVPATLVVGAKDRRRFSAEFDRVRDYGGVLELENIEFSMQGSPVFPGADVACERLQLISRQQVATLSLAIGDDLPYRLDFSGHFSLGVKGAKFTGVSCGGLISAKLTTDFDARGMKFTLGMDFRLWARKPLTWLPHFTRVEQLFQAMGQQKTVVISLEMEGVEAELGRGPLPSRSNFLAVGSFLAEVAALRELNEFFGLNLLMPENLDDVMHTVRDFHDILSMIRIQEAENPEVTMKFTLAPRTEWSDEHPGILSAIEERRPVDIVLAQEVNLTVLGKSFETFVVEISCPQAVVSTVGPVRLTPGMPTKLALRPANGFHWNARNAGLDAHPEGVHIKTR